MIYKIKTNAKINIGLRVLNKRNDGYHNIETIFYPVKIYDTIVLDINKITSKINKFSIETNLTELNNSRNLCINAAKLFIKTFQINKGYEFKIKVNKNIPVGAGLGGGSSDAAAILKVLSKHFMLKTKTLKKLPELALELGSDVPFFLLNKPCYAASRGEKLKPLRDFRIEYNILIVNPAVHISTGKAFKKLKNTSDILKLNNVRSFNLKNKNIFENVFEDIIYKVHPEILEIKNHMYLMGASFSSMSGSGSSVYGFYKEKKNFSEAKNFFEKMKYRVFKG